MPPGGPYTLQFSSTSGGSGTLEDVLFGDVYLCGGQVWAAGRKNKRACVALRLCCVVLCCVVLCCVCKYTVFASACAPSVSLCGCVDSCVCIHTVLACLCGGTVCMCSTPLPALVNGPPQSNMQVCVLSLPPSLFVPHLLAPQCNERC